MGLAVTAGCPRYRGGVLRMHVAIALKDPVKLAEAVRQHYPDRHYALSDSAFVIASRSTAREISDRLGASGPDLGTTIVMEAGSYYGHGPVDLWEWLRVKWE